MPRMAVSMSWGPPQEVCTYRITRRPKRTVECSKRRCVVPWNTCVLIVLPLLLKLKTSRKQVNTKDARFAIREIVFHNLFPFSDNVMLVSS
mmetsp:Transcript_7157/g.18300  ORF Transcript_7157/g.18300 Transcript_7157/m.18300 type:complete len:91 (+) Transcript_7157:92-364(+)